MMTRHFMRILPIAACLSVSLTLGVALWPAAALAQPSRAEAMQALAGVEWTLETDAITALGDGAEQTLMAIADDDSLLNVYRIRALMALKLFQTSDVADYLESRLAVWSNDALSRRTMESFSAGFAQTYPQRVASALTPYLANGNPHLRITAARALRSLNTAQARVAVNAYLSDRAQSWEIEALQNE
ncbi:hypothetical protein [Magnetofaba australis]|nr:hypothetical protein [Magnetofaba australis]